MKYLVCLISVIGVLKIASAQDKFVQNQTAFAQKGGLHVNGLVRAGSMVSNGSLQYYQGIINNSSGALPVPTAGQGVSIYSVDDKLRIYNGRASAKAIVFDELNTDDRTYTFPDITGTLLTENSVATLINKTWNGSVIGSQYGGTGLNSLGAANQLLRVSNDGTALEYFTPPYLTTYDETDPAFSASPSFGINNAHILNWNTAHSWGNHALAGYLTVIAANTTYVNLTGTYDNPSWLSKLNYSKITGTPNTLAGYGIIDAAINSQVVHNTGNESVAGIKVFNNNIGIGVADPAEKLEVDGKIRAKAIKVEPGNWSDFVFGKDYRLASLKEIEDFINKHQHLPGIPSEAEVKANGIDLGEMNVRLLEKIEELTLHLIEQNKKVDELTQVLSGQQKVIDDLMKK